MTPRNCGLIFQINFQAKQLKQKEMTDINQNSHYLSWFVPLIICCPKHWSIWSSSQEKNFFNEPVYV